MPSTLVKTQRMLILLSCCSNTSCYKTILQPFSFIHSGYLYGAPSRNLLSTATPQRNVLRSLKKEDTLFRGQQAVVSLYIALLEGFRKHAKLCCQNMNTVTVVTQRIVQGTKTINYARDKIRSLGCNIAPA